MKKTVKNNKKIMIFNKKLKKPSFFQFLSSKVCNPIIEEKLNIGPFLGIKLDKIE